MALRNILTKEQPGLYKKCRPVTDFNARLHQLLDDMRDTLAPENGVGLAAPQVTYVTQALKAEGWDIDTSVTTVDETVRAIQKALSKEDTSC